MMPSHFSNASKSTNVLTFNFDNGAVFYESILGLLFFSLDLVGF